MADDSELDYIADFLRKVLTTYTVETLETTTNINYINDEQACLVFSGRALGASGVIAKKQYQIQFRNETEALLNATIYALIEGIRKLNARETITSYKRDTSLIEIMFLSSGLDFHNLKAKKWYANVYIIVTWLTI